MDSLKLHRIKYKDYENSMLYFKFAWQKRDKSCRGQECISGFQSSNEQMNTYNSLYKAGYWLGDTMIDFIHIGFVELRGTQSMRKLQNEKKSCPKLDSIPVPSAY